MFNQPPELTPAFLEPIADLLRRAAHPECLESKEAIEEAAIQIARHVWGFVWDCFWAGDRFHPLMTAQERNQIASDYRERAKALRAAMTDGLSGLAVHQLPFAVRSLDRLSELLTLEAEGVDIDDAEGVYIVGDEAQRRSHILGTRLAEEYFRALTPSARWPRYGAGASWSDRAEGLRRYVKTMSAELEGMALFLESVASVLGSGVGGQETGARYMFGSCIAEYRNVADGWPNGSPKYRPPLFAVIDDLMVRARVLGRQRPIGASVDTFNKTLQSMKKDNGSGFLAQYQVEVRDRDTLWVLQAPPAVDGDA